jgi:uncharacterized protein YaaQ
MNDKFILAVVSDNTARSVLEALVAHQFHVTRMSSSGGFLRRGSVSLLVGVDAKDVNSVLDVIRFACNESPPTEVHRATIFVLDAASFEQV